MIAILIGMQSPVCCGTEVAIQQQLQARIVDVEEGTVRFSHTEQTEIGCRRGCAVTAPLVIFGLLIAYVLLRAHFSKQVLIMVE
jgi:hypothetical protein